MPLEIIPEPDYATRLRVRPDAGAVIIEMPLSPMRPYEARYLADQLIEAANAASKQEVAP